MSKFKELVYMCLDELKLMSDDASFTEDHVIFLLSKYRTFLLKLKYSDIKKLIPKSNYQTICLDLIEVPAISGEPCEGGTYLRSKEKIPNLIGIGSTNVYPIDFYNANISFVSRERMKYVGYNRYLLNVIYTSLGPDNYLYFKSSNPQYTYLEKVKMTGIFENIEDIKELQCEENGEIICDIMDMDFPLEEALVPLLILSVVKELAGPSWKPEDTNNNASDDLANLAAFIARNAKSRLQKEMEK